MWCYWPSFIFVWWDHSISVAHMMEGVDEYKLDLDGGVLALWHWLIFNTLFKVLQDFSLLHAVSLRFYCALFDDQCDEVIISSPDRYAACQDNERPCPVWRLDNLGLLWLVMIFLIVLLYMLWCELFLQLMTFPFSHI